ncbi:hypothetical protein Vi05172_g6853 [Venturia inaequalis]|nr:hypothetical protein Vi05172_g6853 [Venturia inaequalis]
MAPALQCSIAPAPHRSKDLSVVPKSHYYYVPTSIAPVLDEGIVVAISTFHSFPPAPATVLFASDFFPSPSSSSKRAFHSFPLVPACTSTSYCLCEYFHLAARQETHSFISQTYTDIALRKPITHHFPRKFELPGVNLVTTRVSLVTRRHFDNTLATVDDTSRH